MVVTLNIYWKWLLDSICYSVSGWAYPKEGRSLSLYFQGHCSVLIINQCRRWIEVVHWMLFHAYDGMNRLIFIITHARYHDNGCCCDPCIVTTCTFKSTVWYYKNRHNIFFSDPRLDTEELLGTVKRFPYTTYTYCIFKTPSQLLARGRRLPIPLFFSDLGSALFHPFYFSCRVHNNSFRGWVMVESLSDLLASHILAYTFRYHRRFPNLPPLIVIAYIL